MHPIALLFKFTCHYPAFHQFIIPICNQSISPVIHNVTTRAFIKISYSTFMSPGSFKIFFRLMVFYPQFFILNFIYSILFPQFFILNFLSLISKKLFLRKYYALRFIFMISDGSKIKIDRPSPRTVAPEIPGIPSKYLGTGLTTTSS